ncbi:MAG TPA: OmpA family protein [Chromatiaceae bacterium]|nr:OmpA family protein [Chromatiaceae bacterium]
METVSQMKQFNKKLTGLVAAMGMATAGAMLPQGAFAGYLTDSSGEVVTDGYGECWKGSWPNPGALEACGDVIAKEAPAPAPVAAPEPGDSDGDGVNDDRDQCPNTPAGSKVDADGCAIVENMTLDLKLVEEEFDFDSAVLKPNMKDSLADFAERVKASPGHESVVVIGHTDSTGPEAYNMQLSLRRAQSVADYLESLGIDDIEVRGEGESNPIADNSTREGRAKNRRVEIITQ